MWRVWRNEQKNSNLTTLWKMDYRGQQPKIDQVLFLVVQLRHKQNKATEGQPSLARQWVAADKFKWFAVKEAAALQQQTLGCVCSYVTHTAVRMCTTTYINSHISCITSSNWRAQCQVHSSLNLGHCSNIISFIKTGVRDSLQNANQQNFFLI